MRLVIEAETAAISRFAELRLGESAVYRESLQER